MRVILKRSKLILFATFCSMLLMIGCGPQASQQGTWSRDDGFKHKATPEVKESKEKPADTVH
jgi:hypothetical protein